MLFHWEERRRKQKLAEAQMWLALCEAEKAHMETVNAFYREHGTIRGCPRVSEPAAEIIDNGIRDGACPDNLPYSAYDILHNYYETQRWKRRIEELTGDAA